METFGFCLLLLRYVSGHAIRCTLEPLIPVAVSGTGLMCTSSIRAAIQ